MIEKNDIQNGVAIEKTTKQKYVVPIECAVSDTIKFRTINLNDNTIYTGKIIGIVDFERARVYGDVAAMHLAMEQGLAQIRSNDILIDVTKQKFFIIELSNGEIVPYAFEWLRTATNEYGYVEKVEVGGTYTIRLYNVNASEADIALNILKTNGYVCKLIASTNNDM